MDDLIIMTVKNGWIVRINSRNGCVGEEYVFSTPQALADFVHEQAEGSLPTTGGENANS